MSEDSAAEPATSARFLVAGLGASAGGLEALEEFFSHTPGDAGIAFVVITHQLSGRPSLMPELLAKRCRMPIVEARQTTALEPNHVYLAPPGMLLSVRAGSLEPVAISDGARPALPIDYFFRALAADQRERSCGIVLSGTGSDGSLGLKEIKGAGGMTMAQDEDTARYSGMPHSAIATEQVDYVMPAGALAKQLTDYARGAIQRPPAADDTASLNHVFDLLKTRTSHDFSSYKRTTIRRRIERRMSLHQLEALGDYVRFAVTQPSELDLLFKELLIGVTSFFRDPEAFQAFEEKILPGLLDGKPDHYVIRCWVPGCSTGEEAYSIAMLIREAMDRMKRHYTVQIFATDIDHEAIDIARAGAYPEAIAADVTPERLARFFSKEEGCYRIRKDIREMLVFAQQNVIADPPFTKLDLLSCRNLLIYLDGELQQRLLPVFHYALRPGGALFLGSSESVGSFAMLFEALDKKWKLFKRREVAAGSYAAQLPHTVSHEVTRAPTVLVARKTHELGVSQLAERTIITYLVPPSVIVHEHGEIVHIHGRTGEYLEPAPGPQTSANIFNMAREGLQLHLTVAMRHASDGEEVVQRGVRVKKNGDHLEIDLRVRRLGEPEALRGLYLVSFERPSMPPAPASAVTHEGDQAIKQIADLSRELQYAKEVHQSTVEELETANEELKSTNEELQSTNEELQSTNEELETSKEEMQSLNEELQTVNAEVQGKMDDLQRVNDDMKNLLNGTNIATVFLDNELNIKRYTEQAKRVIRLIPSDVGRPIGDLVNRLRYSSLLDDAQEVLRSLVLRETEVQSTDGAWYLMRMLPYRTNENVIDGLIVTFVDVTKLKREREAALEISDALATSPTALFGQDAQLRYDWTFCRLFGRDPREIIGKCDADLLSPQEADELVAIKKHVLASGQSVRKRLRLVVQGTSRWYDVLIEPRRDAGGATVGVCGVVTRLED
jgi:two-component system, chemotaxis family, CheB/CheR fusion protein